MVQPSPLPFKDERRPTVDPRENYPINPVVSATGLTDAGWTIDPATGALVSPGSSPATTAAPATPALSTTPAYPSDASYIADPYAAFKAAHSAAIDKGGLGRDITQDQLNDSAYVASLSNELFRLLPFERQQGFDAKRLATLSNQDLMALMKYNPSVISGFGAGRLSSFSQDFGASDLLPFLDKNDPTTATNLRNLYASLGGSANAATPAGGSSQPGAPGQPVDPLQSIRDLIKELRGKGGGRGQHGRDVSSLFSGNVPLAAPVNVNVQQPSEQAAPGGDKTKEMFDAWKMQNPEGSPEEFMQLIMQLLAQLQKSGQSSLPFSSEG